MATKSFEKPTLKNAINYVSFDRQRKTSSQIKISRLIVGFTSTTPVSTTGIPHEECYVLNGTDTIVVKVCCFEKKNRTIEFLIPLSLNK